MPAPRYVNELQENAVWLCLAAVWSLGGLVAWLAAVSTHATWVGSSSGLALLAALASGISIAVRLPILSSPPRTSSLSDHVVWLVSTCASVNWLGFFVLQSSQWPDALPAAMLLLVGEVWFHFTAWRRRALPWLHDSLSSLAERLSGLGVERLTQSTGQPIGELIATDSPDWESDLESDMDLDGNHRGEQPTADQPDEQIDRRQVQGVDECGQRYVSGEIRVRLTSDQQTQVIIVAFSPPFSGPPQVDFESESDEAEVKLVNGTPTGMRLEIRRFRGREPLIFPLQWYAAEVELGNMSTASNAKRVLP